MIFVLALRQLRKSPGFMPETGGQPECKSKRWTYGRDRDDNDIETMLGRPPNQDPRRDDG